MKYSESYFNEKSKHILQENYVSPYIGQGTQADVDTFIRDLSHKELNVDAFHRAYDTAFEQLGVFNTQVGNYNGRSYKYEVFADDGTFTAKKVFGVIKDLEAKYGKHKIPAIDALGGAWSVIYGIDYKTRNPIGGVYKHLVQTSASQPNQNNTQQSSSASASSNTTSSLITTDDILNVLENNTDFIELDNRIKNSEILSSIYTARSLINNSNMTNKAMSKEEAAAYVMYELYVLLITQSFIDYYSKEWLYKFNAKTGKYAYMFDELSSLGQPRYVYRYDGEKYFCVAKLVKFSSNSAVPSGSLAFEIVPLSVANPIFIKWFKDCNNDLTQLNWDDCTIALRQLNSSDVMNIDLSQLNANGAKNVWGSFILS